jgi:dTMP kinase
MGVMAKSFFLEGTDGSGKSTQFKLLKEYFAEKNIELLTLREPGGTDYYEALREFYLHAPHKHPPISDALLSAAGRAANIAETRAALAQGKWVMSDRAYLSSYVYQAVQGIPLQEIKDVNQFALSGFEYDIKILLDVPVEVAEARVEEATTKKDYWESQGRAFFTEIREKYLALAKEEGLTIIDASTTPEEVHKKIIEVLGI